MSTLDLLERYLQAVGKYLPEETRTETLRELRANLLDEMDARAESQGRTLEEGDVVAVLRAHGKPEAVALRYLPQRSLIGPAIYPFYLYTLRRAMPIWFFAYTLAKVVELADGRRVTFARALAEYGSGMIPAALAMIACITLVFVVIDKLRDEGKLGKSFYEWDPTKLEAVKTHEETETATALWKRIIDVAFQSLWLAYLLWVPFHPFWIFGPGIFYLQSLSVTWAPVWVLFYQLLIVGTVVRLVAKIMMMSVAARATGEWINAVGELIGVVSVVWLAFHSVFFVAVNQGADLAQLNTVNHAMTLAFRVAAAVATMGFVKERWKKMRGGVLKTQLAL